jgi:hypothetical protein
MAKSRKTDRYRLFLYERLIGRQRLPSLFIGIIFLGLWYGISFRSLEWPSPETADLLLTGGLLSLAFWIFTLLGPRQAYVQPRDDHLRVQTPVFRLKIRYKQIINTRPVKMGRIFSPTSLPMGQRRFLSPLFGLTALTIDLNEQPRFLAFHRLFFHQFMFSPDTPGLVLLVEDWIELSQTLSSRIDAWRMAHPIYTQNEVSGAAQIIESSKEEKEKRFKFF